MSGLLPDTPARPRPLSYTQPAAGDQMLTPADVARRCQISTKTVLRAIQAGRLRASRLGQRGAYRLRAADVDAWLDATRVRFESSLEEPVPTLQHIGAQAAMRGRLVVSEGMGRRP